MAYLALVRHGQTENNSQPGMRTGQLDISLTDKGREQAKVVASLIKPYSFDLAIRSSLIRTQETLDEILAALDIELPTTVTPELIERNWGSIEGMSKADVDEAYPEEVQALWWTWEGNPPGGESYQELFERSLGYYESEIVPLLKQGKNILLVGHQAVFKLLRMALENVPRSQFQDLAMENGQAYLYDIAEDGAVKSFKLLTADTRP